MCFEQIMQTYVMPIGQTVMFITTIVLVILTGRYLRATKGMAKVMMDEHEIKLTPCVNIHRQQYSLSPTDFIYHCIYNVKNSGSYTIKLIDVVVESYPTETPDQIFYTGAYGQNFHIAPGESFPIDLKDRLNGVSRYARENDQRFNINIKTTFKFINANGEEFKRETVWREGVDGLRK